MALRLNREDFARLDLLETRLSQLLAELGVAPAEVDLILDLRDVQEGHLAADEMAAIGMLTQLPWATNGVTWRSPATGMPVGVRSFPRDEITPTRRVEWWLWQGVWEQRLQLPRMPTFADYTIAHPDPVEDAGDNKVRKVSAHLRYTTKRDWLIVKSLPIGDGGIDRLPELFRALTERSEYESADFCSADRWIDQVSRRNVSPGNATTWRQQGTVRHLTLVTRQLSNLDAA